MTLVDAKDLAVMRADQTLGMYDTCKIGAYTAPSTSGGSPSYSYGAAIACRFVPGANGESRTAKMTVVVTPARVRLPMGTTVTAKDRVQITHRFGVALGTALEFNAQGQPSQGATCITLELREATP